MVCIYCAQKTKIVNSRVQKRSHTTWRRHHCPSCGQTFSTQERVDLAASVAYIASNSSTQPFGRETLLQSLYESLKHRPRAITEALDLTDTVITKLLPQMQQGSLSRQVVIETVQKTLKNFDPVAATTYVAYHPLKKS
jgi:transcriptional regulator NrdR family protein